MPPVEAVKGTPAQIRLPCSSSGEERDAETQRWRVNYDAK